MIKSFFFVLFIFFLGQKAAVRWFVHPNLRKIQRVILHNYFTYFGMVVVTANLLVISVSILIALLL